MLFMELIRSHIKEINLDEVTCIQPQHCTSFKLLMEIYRQNMTVTQSFEDCMAICTAVHLAVPLEGEPLWIYLVGRPSGGKSTICELLSSDEFHTMVIHKYTGLISGNKQGKHLVPMMQGKCVITPDGTLMLESTPQQLSNVYGELRGIFDGNLNFEYRNGVSASFANISFGMIIGITERVYALNMAALGERFLHCKLDTSRDIEVKRNMNAIGNIFNSIGRTNFEGNDVGDMRSFPKQRAFTAGFLSHLHSKIRYEDIIRPRYTQTDIDLIQALADVIACSRAQASRSKEFGSSEVMYDSKPEGTTRAAKLLAKLAICLCYVHGETEITPTIKKQIIKVGIDTAMASSKQYSIIRQVALSRSGLTKTAIAGLTGMPLETIQRRIEDLLSLGILIGDEETNRPVRGRTIPTLTCIPWIRDAFRLVDHYAVLQTRQDTQNGTPVRNNNKFPPRKKRETQGAN